MIFKGPSESGALTFKSRSPESKEKKLGRRSQDIDNHRQTVSVKKTTKEMHPSSKYLASRRSNSHEEKEKLRKKELKKSGDRNSGQPKVVTEKRKKPTYDTRESKIWNE